MFSIYKTLKQALDMASFYHYIYLAKLSY